jgi:hypothetical protein
MEGSTYGDTVMSFLDWFRAAREVGALEGIRDRLSFHQDAIRVRVRMGECATPRF